MAVNRTLIRVLTCSMDWSIDGEERGPSEWHAVVQHLHCALRGHCAVSVLSGGFDHALDPQPARCHATGLAVQLPRVRRTRVHVQGSSCHSWTGPHIRSVARFQWCRVRTQHLLSPGHGVVVTNCAQDGHGLSKSLLRRQTVPVVAEWFHVEYVVDYSNLRNFLIRQCLVGDLCADTRPSPMNPMCMDPPGQDCSGQAWFNTPIHNYMGFTFAMDVSDAK